MRIHLSHRALALAFVLLSLLIHQSSFASANTVYSISSGKPLISADSLKVNTITRGFASNQPVYKSMVQTVPKALFLFTFRRVAMLTPYGIAALVAYEYFVDDETGEIRSNESAYSVDSVALDSVGYCWSRDGNLPVTTYSNCLYASRLNEPFHSFRISVADQLVASGQGRLGFGFAFLPANGIINSSYPSVTDDELYNNILNDETFTNDVFLNADGSVNQDYFPNPEFEYYTPEDTELMMQYGQGLLQSTDSLADYYLSPTELARIAELYANANKTDDEIAQNLTAYASQPMTQSQYASEQTLKEARAVVDANALSTASTSAIDKTTELDEQFSILDTLMTNLTDLPSGLPVVPIFQYSSSCRQIVIGADSPYFGITGSIDFPSQEQCTKILAPFKDMMGWLMYINVFFLMMFQLYKELH